MEITRKRLRGLIRLAVEAARADPNMAPAIIADSLLLMAREAEVVVASNVVKDRIGAVDENACKQVRRVRQHSVHKIILTARQLGMKDIAVEWPSNSGPGRVSVSVNRKTRIEL